MKKRLLAFVFICISFPQLSFSQSDYWPFIEEGKRWVYDYKDSGGSSGTQMYYIGEDTLDYAIKWSPEEKCKKVYLYKDYSDINYLFANIAESTGRLERIVNMNRDGDCHPSYIYDFGLSIDNAFYIETHAWSYAPSAWKVIEQKEVVIRGRKTRLHILKSPFKNNSLRPNYVCETLYWFEGIGSPYGFCPVPFVMSMNENIKFKACYVGDELIATYDDLIAAIAEAEGTDAIKEIEETKQRTVPEGYYDMQGRKLAEEPERGLYIHDGKKYAK